MKYNPHNDRQAQAMQAALAAARKRANASGNKADEALIELITVFYD